LINTGSINQNITDRILDLLWLQALKILQLGRDIPDIFRPPVYIDRAASVFGLQAFFSNLLKAYFQRFLSLY